MINGDQSLSEEKDAHAWIKDIKEDSRIHDLYLVKSKKMGLTKNGDPFLSLSLADRTGDLEARVWENAEELSLLFSEGDILEVEGHVSSYRNRLQLILTDLKPFAEKIDPSVFIESTPLDTTAMMRSLRKILKEISDPNLNTLIEKFLSDRRFVSLFKTAPAAKNFHHGYIGGLLEHTLSVCRLAESIADHYPELDRDLLIAGAFLHDIGKIKELRIDKGVEYSDEGRLLGHLVLGVNMVEEKISGIKEFPKGLSIKLNHLILSHHGEYDFGSPKRPKFPEAFALHLIDDMDAKINGLTRFMEQDRREGSWTEYNRMFERYLLKGIMTEEDMEREEIVPREEEAQKALF
ncbi:MAG: HD domain-containing protein [Deltaproteobacteria bacterium]|nr:HD domain-containing protein [Deltaproteobacteria bacterium]